jgi:hypothetical protein
MLATLIDARPSDVPCASIVPTELPTVVYANHFCVEKSIAAETFHSRRLRVVISTKVEDPRARMLVRCAFLFAHTFAWVKVRWRRVISRRDDAKPIGRIKEILETYECFDRAQGSMVG